MDGLRHRRVDPSGAGIEVCVPCAEDHAACGAGRHCEGCGNACDCGSVRLGRRRARTPARPRRDPQTSQVQLGYRYYVVAELPQSFDGRLGKVLISEEAGQRLGLLILLDLTVDLVEVTGDKRPGVDQVGRSECGECAQDLGFSQTEPPVVLQRPDRDSCSRDPRITTTYPSRSLDPRAEASQELFDRREHHRNPSPSLFSAPARPQSRIPSAR